MRNIFGAVLRILCNPPFYGFGKRSGQMLQQKIFWYERIKFFYIPCKQIVKVLFEKMQEQLTAFSAQNALEITFTFS